VCLAGGSFRRASPAYYYILLLAQPRVLFAMGRDGLLPPWTARSTPRFRTPHVTTLVCGLAVAACAPSPPLKDLPSSVISRGTSSPLASSAWGSLFSAGPAPRLPAPSASRRQVNFPGSAALASFSQMLLHAGGIPAASCCSLAGPGFGPVLFSTGSGEADHLIKKAGPKPLEIPSPHSAQFTDRLFGTFLHRDSEKSSDFCGFRRQVRFFHKWSEALQ